MRHSDIRLTMGLYTDPKLLDVQGALEALPALPLDGTAADAIRATGTDDSLVRAVAPTFDNPCTELVFPVKMAGGSADRGKGATSDVRAIPVNESGPLSASDNGMSKKRLAPGMGWLPEVISECPGRVTRVIDRAAQSPHKKREPDHARSGFAVPIVRFNPPSRWGACAAQFRRGSVASD
jgi:hypothetical protein